MRVDMDERAPFECTKISKLKVVRVCPHCKTGNLVGKHWFGGACRGCDKYFNRDQALDKSEMVGEVKNEPSKLINEKVVKIKGEMEERAYAYAEEQQQIKRDGERRRSHKSKLNKHFDGREFR